MNMFYRLLADLVLVIHFAFVAFVVLGLVGIWIGWLFRWAFVRNIWFRGAHLLAMGVVVAEAWTGVICPLTIWESRLRHLAGQGERYTGTFIEYWLRPILFHEFSPLTFKILYAIFFMAIALSLWVVKPEWRGRKRADG